MALKHDGFLCIVNADDSRHRAYRNAFASPKGNNISIREMSSLNSIYIYGNVLYKSMCYIKGKCSDKRMSRKFKTEIQNALNLWNICLTLMLDEAVSKTDNTDILKKYLNSDPKISISGTDDNDTVLSYTSFPTEAVSLMVKYIAEINICILNYRQNFRKINRYLFALHNLPRCLLSPQLKEYISQKEAIEYSRISIKEN